MPASLQTGVVRQLDKSTKAIVQYSTACHHGNRSTADKESKKDTITRKEASQRFLAEGRGYDLSHLKTPYGRLEKCFDSIVLLTFIFATLE
ncbi:hypothetical protein KQX54_012080 [Cotesia glomerata]|uniref:Uncharacterized protein n=1 Tax=Cotesia glomerata TaxID=32391 RepID=A0AAV7J7D7_COTGL|nr:hypothetical protein KQX54_012080 [Cotesia glomerata]